MRPENRMPFWTHQAVEYGAGILLASQAIGAPRPLVPVLAGSLLVVMAATADGPLSMAKWFPKRVHHVLDWLMGAGLVLAGVFGASWTSEIGRIFTVIAGIVLLVLAWRTDYTAKPTRAQRRAAAASPPTQAAAPAAPPVTSGPPPAPKAATPPASGLEGLGRRLGRAVGKGVTSYRAPDALPPSDSPDRPT